MVTYAIGETDIFYLGGRKENAGQDLYPGVVYKYIDDEVGDHDGYMSDIELISFFKSKGFIELTTSDSIQEADIAYFSKNHAAKLKYIDIKSGKAIFESKLGPNVIIEHVLEQLEGETYGHIQFFFKREHK